MEEVLFEMSRGVSDIHTSEVRIYNGKRDRVKVLTFMNSGPNEMHIEFLEERTPRKRHRRL